MNLPMDLSAHLRPVVAQIPGGSCSVSAYTDGRDAYFADSDMALIADRLVGMRTLTGAPLGLVRSASGWSEHQGSASHELRRVDIAGVPHFQLDTSTWSPATKTVVTD